MFFLISILSFNVEASRIEPRYVPGEAGSSLIKPNWIPVDCHLKNPTCKLCCRCFIIKPGENRCAECCP
ncbi:hypothetical protein AQUCO_00200109v1 [Aquilegia coerulea]|uniref:Uncharacterized protein n=1 Tax=Aquilegia coerulea TaxID=218851 RepID=A0A2G5F1Q0_AQUCA|nr:hypothetical protein AQUCO_00200109v1 [Aquilegia coerulea]